MPRSRRILKFQMHCSTENATVYEWREDDGTQPTHCPHDISHELQEDQTCVVDEVSDTVTKLSNLPLTPFDRVLTSEETVLLEIKPGNGISKLRDIVTTEGASAVTNSLGEAEYTLTATGPGFAQLRTAERGRYMAGTAAETGIGGHLMAPLGLGHSLKFGIYDDHNGFFFDIADFGLFVVVMKDGVETRINRADFNVDKMDGEGPSKVLLNPSKGYIWYIRFSWYGYGIVEFSLASQDMFNEQHIVPMHRYYSEYRASVSTFNLPITVRLTADERVAADSTAVAYITGRKYSVLGKFQPTSRTCGTYATFADPNAPVGWSPVFSLRRKAGRLSAPVTLSSLEAYTDNGTAIVAIFVAADTTTAVWTTPPDCSASETALEYTESPADIASAVLIWKGFARASATVDADIGFFMTEADAVTVCVKDMANVSPVSVGLRWVEEW